jgi:hypothetical protein
MHNTPSWQGFVAEGSFVFKARNEIISFLVLFKELRQGSRKGSCKGSGKVSLV